MESSRQTLVQDDLQGDTTPADVQADTTVYDVASMPGFRFQPTEEELVGFYLRSMVIGNPRLEVELINVLDLYRYDPWELPAMAFMQGEREWLFFCPRDKKYPNGARPNRVTASGYWKATGTDRQVRRAQDARCIGLKKTLVFYTGKAPKGRKTEWIMNEYRLPQHEQHLRKSINGLKDPREVALCRIYKKPPPNPSNATLMSADLILEEPALGAESSTCRDPGGVERDSILHCNASSEQPCASTSSPTSPSSPKFVNFSPSKKPKFQDKRDAICATAVSSQQAMNPNQHDTRTSCDSSVKTETGTLSSVLYLAPENVDSIDALLAQMMDAEAARRGRPLFLNSPPASQIRVATPASAPGARQHELASRLAQLPGDHVAHQADNCCSNVSPTMSTLDRLLKASMWSTSPQFAMHDDLQFAMHDDLLPVSSSSSFFSMNQFGRNYGATHEPLWLQYSSTLPARQSLGLQDYFQ